MGSRLTTNGALTLTKFSLNTNAETQKYYFANKLFASDVTCHADHEVTRCNSVTCYANLAEFLISIRLLVNLENDTNLSGGCKD